MKKQVEVVVVVVVVLLLGTGPGPAGPPEPFRPEGWWWVVVGRCADVTDVVTGEFQPIGGRELKTKNGNETRKSNLLVQCVCVSAMEFNMDVVLRQVYNLQVYE